MDRRTHVRVRAGGGSVLERRHRSARTVGVSTSSTNGCAAVLTLKSSCRVAPGTADQGDRPVDLDGDLRLWPGKAISGASSIWTVCAAS